MITAHIQDHYGSKSGLLNFSIHQLKLWLGRYRPAQDLTQIKRLVFICSGNICRSPFAEKVARAKGFDAISFGLDCRGGDAANERATALAGAHQGLMEQHRSQNLRDYSAHAGDLLLVMEPEQLTRTKAQLPNSEVALLGLWCKPSVAYLHDPYAASEAFFERCLSAIEDATTHLVESIYAANQN
ncbi:low molecular weight phosphatase family protein [Aliagarivorans taiwanensis]|uniref:arsenate-mycothiol transferase ArsC n=1 Tax=Aliagarivorans taiwanensis TaxID=561966 RepID=UPI000555BE57|nr:hypothetical protein [Aliagarivorans taiwanensis]